MGSLTTEVLSNCKVPVLLIRKDNRVSVNCITAWLPLRTKAA